MRRIPPILIKNRSTPTQVAEPRGQERHAISIFHLDASSLSDSHSTDDPATAPNPGEAPASRSQKRSKESAWGRVLIAYGLRSVFGEDAARGWNIVTDAQGKPNVLVPSGETSGALFSLSHSDCLIVCAVAADPVVRLGVDVERGHRRSRGLSSLCSEVLHAEETSRLFSLDPEQRWRCFYECWTVKESLGKALGVGLGLPFREFSIFNGRMERCPAEWLEAAHRWRFANLVIDDGAIVGLAWENRSDRPISIVHHELTGDDPDRMAAEPCSGDKEL